MTKILAIKSDQVSPRVAMNTLSEKIDDIDHVCAIVINKEGAYDMYMSSFTTDKLSYMIAVLQKFLFDHM